MRAGFPPETRAEALRLRAAGVVWLVFLALLLALSVATYTKAFGDHVTVTVQDHRPIPTAAAGTSGLALAIRPLDDTVLGDTVAKFSRCGTQLYVTPGVGFWGPPARIGGRPEVTVIELRAP